MHCFLPPLTFSMKFRKCRLILMQFGPKCHNCHKGVSYVWAEIVGTAKDGVNIKITPTFRFHFSLALNDALEMNSLYWFLLGLCLRSD